MKPCSRRSLPLWIIIDKLKELDDSGIDLDRLDLDMTMKQLLHLRTDDVTLPRKQQQGTVSRTL